MSYLETSVTQMLQEVDVDFLTAWCEEQRVPVPTDKADDRSHLLGLCLGHLESEEMAEKPDRLAVLCKLFNELGERLKTTVSYTNPTDGDVKPKVLSGEGGGLPGLEGHVKAPPTISALGNAKNVTSGGVKQPVVASSALSYHKLREFKISGSINAGKPGTLSYVSLSCQLKQAETAGYELPEIIAAVIKALPAGSSFRNLLETKGNSKDKLDKVIFTKLLRGHFKEKDSSFVLQELLNCYQQAGEDAHAFCCRAMALRDRVKTMSEEEGAPWDPEILQSRLYHAIFTGLKQSSIRMELNTTLKEGSLSDEDLLAEVSLAEANETERESKIKKKADVAILEGNKKGGSSEKKTDEGKGATSGSAESKVLLAAIEKLTTQVNQLTTNTNTQNNKIVELERRLVNPAGGQATPAGTQVPPAGGGQNNRGPRNRRGRDFRCENCIAAGVGYCNHCFMCKEVGHRISECPLQGQSN